MTETVARPAAGQVVTKPPTHKYHWEDGVPASWYCVAWSDEVREDSVLDLRYFGADLICFRSPSGEARVFDAHCPHLGAHLGDGCMIDGEVECPFHGWRWNSDGENTLIPYAEKTTRRTLIPWLVHEVNGMVFVWYDPSGSEPTWRIPAYEQHGSDEYLNFYPDFCRRWPAMKLHPQQSVENTTDPAHVTYVHHASEVPLISWHGAEGPVFKTEMRYEWGGGKQSTWLTPDGPVDGGLLAECWGIGFIATTYIGIHPTIQFTAVTPVDEQGKESVFFSAITGAKGNSGRLSGPEFAQRLADYFFEQVSSDEPIWARQTLIEHPPYPKLEARAYADMRAWAATFYGEEK